MRPHRWSQLFDLLPDALALPPHERKGFVDNACRRENGLVDEDLKTELLNLLRASGAADEAGALSSPLAGVADEIAIEQRLSRNIMPERVGPWRPIRRIGSGGMGVVYAAERLDDSFTQSAALKLIRDGFADDFHDRFLRERAILATLVHPGIARLVDGGLTDDGSHYIALELVDGQPLTDFAASNNLTIDARIELFIEACDAVAFAHQNLVVHRDLKPSNILVSTTTGKPQIKLLDFGIAKLLDDENSLHTRTGLGPMTPAYAAPEQLLHEPITTATDVYSLGVVLYELVTGNRPYSLDTLTAAETERVITEVVPELPSRVVGDAHQSQSISGDLDVVIMKALAKDTARRYQSAEALADDIRRYIGGWPVRAKPATVSYRFGMFLKRNRVGVASAIATLVLLAALATWFAVRITTERTIATSAAAQATAEATRAEAIAGFLERILRAPNSRWYVTGEAKGPDTPVRAVLDEAAKQIDVEFQDDPELRADLHHIMGDTYYGLGMIDESKKHHRMVLEIRQSIYPPRHPKTAEALYYMSLISNAQDDQVERIKLLRNALSNLRYEDQSNNYPFIIGELAHLEIDFGRLAVADSLMDESNRFVLNYFVEGSDAAKYRERSLYTGALLKSEIQARIGNSESAISWLSMADSLGQLIGPTTDTLAEKSWGRISTCTNGLVHTNAAQYSTAERMLTDCIKAVDSFYGSTYLTETPRSDLVNLYIGAGQLEKARPYLNRHNLYQAFVDSIRKEIYPAE